MNELIQWLALVVLFLSVTGAWIVILADPLIDKTRAMLGLAQTTRGVMRWCARFFFRQS